MGFSIADQLSGHFAALGIIAAVLERDRTGCGQVLGVAMVDAIAWLTQLAWQVELPRKVQLIQAMDGWVAASGPEETVNAALDGIKRSSLSRTALVERFHILGIPANAVLDAHEALDQPIVRSRRSLYELGTPSDGIVQTLGVPIGLTRTPPLRPKRMHALGEDNGLLPAVP
jgi:crotonobetainyl-CoA:carnitine CoA-transferase CaiB-like acyl-CoA transferase